MEKTYKEKFLEAFQEAQPSCSNEVLQFLVRQLVQQSSHVRGMITSLMATHLHGETAIVSPNPEDHMQSVGLWAQECASEVYGSLRSMDPLEVINGEATLFELEYQFKLIGMNAVGEFLDWGSRQK